MPKPNRFLWAVLAAGVLSLPAAASAETVRGHITTIDPQARSFQLTTTNRETMAIDVLRIMSAVSLDGLGVGDKVSVEGTRGSDGTFNAAAVSPEGSGPALSLSGPAAGDPGAARAVDAESFTSGSTGADSGAQTAAAQSGNPKLE